MIAHAVMHELCRSSRFNKYLIRQFLLPGIYGMLNRMLVRACPEVAKKNFFAASVRAWI